VVWNEGAHEYVLMNKRFVYRLWQACSRDKFSMWQCDFFHIRLYCEVCIVGGMYDCNFHCASYVTSLQCVIKETWRWQGNEENLTNFHNPWEKLGKWGNQRFWSFKGMEWHYLVKVAIAVDEWLNNWIELQREKVNEG
jgi:hypothetical protein